MLRAAVHPQPARPRADQRRSTPRPPRPTRASSAVLDRRGPPDLPPLPCIDAEETTQAVQPARHRLGQGPLRRRAGGRRASPRTATSPRTSLSLVVVDYEPLAGGRRPGAGDGARARRSSTRRRTSATRSRYRLGDPDAAFAAAPHVAHASASPPSATRGCRWRRRGAIAEWDPRDRVGHADRPRPRSPTSVKRDVCTAASGFPRAGVRVLVPDVGGGVRGEDPDLSGGDPPLLPRPPARGAR